MRLDNAKPVDSILLRYVIIHSSNDLGEKLKEVFEDIALNSYNISDVTAYFQSSITSAIQNRSTKLSIAEIQVSDMPYSSVEEFEDAILDVVEILEVCKIRDSFKVEENREFLAELYVIEMRIREIYTVLARLQDADIRNSGATILREYQDNEEALKKRLMNEFFFIEFSHYKNVDERQKPKLEDLLDALRRVRRVKDISGVVTDLSYPTLHLEERFNELSRVPEAIGRLERFRNSIAHNRHILEDDIRNFETAKSIIDDVYKDFLEKLRDGEI